MSPRNKRSRECESIGSLPFESEPYFLLLCDHQHQSLHWYRSDVALCSTRWGQFTTLINITASAALLYQAFHQHMLLYSLYELVNAGLL